MLLLSLISLLKCLTKSILVRPYNKVSYLLLNEAYLHENKQSEIRSLFIMIVTLFPLSSSVGAPRFPKSPPGQVVGYLGKETKLQCNVLGNPTPEVNWARSPATPLPHGRTVSRKDSLFITGTAIGDDGIYICTAANKYGMIIHATLLTVRPVGE